MVQQSKYVSNKILFRILKNKSSAASNICEKLKQDIRNINLLSDDELCELWKLTKSILTEAQKVCKSLHSRKGRYAKEYIVMINLIRVITAMAHETILQRSFVPNILLQSVMMLHSVILPNMKNNEVKDEISCFLEKWYRLNMIWKEKVIINTLKYLIGNCDSSVQHVKRLYEVKSAIMLLKSVEDMQEIFKLVRKETVILLEEGRLLILYLFTLGEQYILGIYNNVKVMLESAEYNVIIKYADLYATAWINATEELKKIIGESCLQNIIFHCFRGHRDSVGRGKLSKNLLIFLTAIYDNENLALKQMLCNQCKLHLWKHLKAPGSYIRCNAAEILFIINPIHYASLDKESNKTHHHKYYRAVSDLLKDSNYQVCNITMHATFKILEKYWSYIPTNVIREWLNILLNYTKTSSCTEIRVGVFVGLKHVVDNVNSHSTFRNFLPNFAGSIYDVNTNVVEALIELIWYAQTYAAIPFWNIVPLSYILDRLEKVQETSLLKQIVKLVWLRILPNDKQDNKPEEEILCIGTINLNAVRRLCFYSDSVIKRDMSLNLIKNILSMIEVNHLSTIELSKEKCCKRAKMDDTENQCDEVKVKKYKKDEKYVENQNIDILIDVTAMLLARNVKSIESNKYNVEEENVLQTVAKLLQKFPHCLNDTSRNKSITFLFSLIPPKFFPDETEILETFMKHLCNPKVSEDMLLTVIYVLMKWRKGEAILFASAKLFTKSLNITSQDDQENYDNVDTSQINEKNLELSLRIVKHLLHVEYQSILMNKYHHDVLKFWKMLYALRSVIEEKLQNESIIWNSQCEELVVDFFNIYVSMVPLLHKKDVFDASEQFSSLLFWIKKTVVPYVRDIDNTRSNQIPIRIIKGVFDTSNLLLKQCKSTSELCCEIVLLYCSCISLSGGIIFMNNVFDAIMVLLDFSKAAYENGESNLLSIIVPNFLCATMVTLNRYSEDTVIKHTNNLKILPELTQKYFSVIKNTFNNREMNISYVTIMFNTAVSSISTKMTGVLQDTSVTTENILLKKYPYLAEKILQIIFHTEKYKELSFHVLTKTIINCNKIDMLSTLLIIYRICKSSNKAFVNRFKNITLATKFYNQRQPHDTPFDRTVDSAINIVIKLILQE